MYFIKKSDIKAIFEEIFSVKVISVNSYILPGRSRRLGKFQGYKNSYKRIFIKIVSIFIKMNFLYY